MPFEEGAAERQKAAQKPFAESSEQDGWMPSSRQGSASVRSQWMMLAPYNAARIKLEARILTGNC